MSPSARHRLNLELQSQTYQRAQVKKFIIVLALLGIFSLLMAAVTSCTSAGIPADSRPATIQLTERDLRDARGRFAAPVHAVTGEPAAAQQTIYRTASGAEMHGPVYRLHSTEIPQLTGH